MSTRTLDDVIRRARNWPEDAQAELARLAREIEAELGEAVYRATPEELAGIDRGLHDSAEGKFASEADVEAVLNKRRGG